jgi:hypothetical protein
LRLTRPVPKNCGRCDFRFAPTGLLARPYSSPSATFIIRTVGPARGECGWLAFLAIQFKAISKEVCLMCKINTVLSKKELGALKPKQRRALQKKAIHHVRNSPEIHKIISAHPRVRKIVRTKPNAKFRAAMRKKLGY